MPITWRNVNVDSAVGDSIRNYQRVADGLSKGITGIGDAALKYDQSIVDAQTNQALAQVAGYQDAGQLSADRGNIMQNLGRADATKVANALNSREAGILKNDGSRIANQAGQTELNYLEPKLQQEATGRLADINHTQATTKDIGFQQGLSMDKYNFDVSKQKTADRQWQADYNQQAEQFASDLGYKYDTLQEQKRANRVSERLDQRRLNINQQQKKASIAAASAVAGGNRENSASIANTLSSITDKATYDAALQSMVYKYGLKKGMSIMSTYQKGIGELRKSGMTKKPEPKSAIGTMSNMLGVDQTKLTPRDNIQLGAANRSFKTLFSEGVPIEGIKGKYKIVNDQQKNLIRKYAMGRGLIKPAGKLNWGSDNITTDEKGIANMKIPKTLANALDALKGK